MTAILRAAAVVLALVLCAGASAQASQAELALIRSQIDSARNSLNQLKAMGADPSMTGPLESQIRYLEEQYQRLAAGQSTTAYNGPTYNGGNGGYAAPGSSGNGSSSGSASRPTTPNSDPFAGYNPVGPNGQNCSPYYDGTLNRMLVPPGCPMPGSSASNAAPAPRPSSTMPDSTDYRAGANDASRGGSLDPALPRCSKGGPVPCLKKDGTVKSGDGGNKPKITDAWRKDKGEKKGKGGKKGKNKNKHADDDVEDPVP